MTLEIGIHYVSIKYGDEVINASIKENCFGFFLDVEDENNDILFKVVGIDNIREFQWKILGYKDEMCGSFPYCKSKDDVIKLLKALVSVYNNPKRYKHIKFKFKL